MRYIFVGATLILSVATGRIAFGDWPEPPWVPTCQPWPECLVTDREMPHPPGAWDDDLIVDNDDLPEPPGPPWCRPWPECAYFGFQGNIDLVLEEHPDEIASVGFDPECDFLWPPPPYCPDPPDPFPILTGLWDIVLGVGGNQGAELGWSAERGSTLLPEVPLPPCPNCPPFYDVDDMDAVDDMKGFTSAIAAAYYMDDVDDMKANSKDPEVLHLWGGIGGVGLNYWKHNYWKQVETSDGSLWGLGIGHDVSNTVGQAPLNAFIDPTTPWPSVEGSLMW